MEVEQTNLAIMNELMELLRRMGPPLQRDEITHAGCYSLTGPLDSDCAGEGHQQRTRHTDTTTVSSQWPASKDRFR